MKSEQRTLNTEPKANRSLAALCVLGVLAAGIAAGALNSGAQQTNADSIPSFDTFNIITRNNIFDPNRRSGLIERPTTYTHPHDADAFALVGTMSYAKGQFAFFDSAIPQYKKVLEPGATIAGYTVKEIMPNAITLAANGKDIEMKVGAQMRNEGDNKWQLSARTEEPVSTEPDNASAAAEPSAPPAGSSPEANDVLKRLMEQRQQELK